MPDALVQPDTHSIGAGPFDGGSYTNDEVAPEALDGAFKQMPSKNVSGWACRARWTSVKDGPDYLFVSPGLHDCYHEPDQYEHHARELGRLIEHLAALPQTVVYIDANPVTRAVDDKKALKCLLYVNSAAHAIVRKRGMLMFSRQTMIVSGDQRDASGEFPMHQADETVSTEVKYLLAWLGCIMEHRRAGTLQSND